VSAWYAIKHGERPNEDYEAFRGREPSPLGMKAFMASAPSGADPAFDAAVERLRTEAEAAGEGGSESVAASTFRAILDMAFAAMFGHEASHLEVGPPYCAVSDRSRVEESGIWAVLLRVSSSDELYKPSSPVAGEVAADRCASRRIRLQRAVLSAGPLSAGEQQFVRRAAADIISTMLLTRVDAPNGRAVFRINDAYLYAHLRIIAVGG
jgi:hypothetical protein